MRYIVRFADGYVTRLPFNVREIELTGEERWAWGRNGEIRKPGIVTVNEMSGGEVWISVYANRRTRENGTSPIDLHISRKDARALGTALLMAGNDGDGHLESINREIDAVAHPNSEWARERREGIR